MKSTQKKHAEFPPKLGVFKNEPLSFVKATSWTFFNTNIAIMIIHVSEMVACLIFWVVELPMYQFLLMSVAIVFGLKAIGRVLRGLKVEQGLILMLKTTEQALAKMRRNMEEK